MVGLVSVALVLGTNAAAASNTTKPGRRSAGPPSMGGVIGRGHTGPSNERSDDVSSGVKIRNSSRS